MKRISFSAMELVRYLVKVRRSELENDFNRTKSINDQHGVLEEMGRLDEFLIATNGLFVILDDEK
jgi:hypothetical protein